MKKFYFKIWYHNFHLIFFSIFLFVSFQGKSQNISVKIFGQNAWMPYSIGSIIYNGKLDSIWKKVIDSKAKIVRYGGIAVDKNMPTHNQYLSIIDSIKYNGMEPVIQVPFYNNKFTAAQAAEIVEFVNIVSHKNVKYWVIGNEPDNVYGYVNSAQVADYIKKFSAEMKKKDPTIKIIAPETAWYNQNILDGLTTPGGVSDITGKDSLGNFIVDLISFHIFPFRGTQKRSEVISFLSGPGNFEDNLSLLTRKIADCNSFHQRNSNSPLRIAVTEANINWKNPQADGVFGVGANSFLGGQFWAEMIGICMKKNVDFINFWSVIEGNELGYLNQVSTLPKPSYYHFKMLADNFNGIYCNGKDNKANIKSFGSKNGNQISVIILNQDQSNDFIYKLRLDTNLISGTNPLKINIDAGTAIEYSDTAFEESSALLVFNSSGKLIKKCVYKLYGNADKNMPPVCNSISSISPLTATITSPSNNASFNEGSSITIQATASGGTGPIQKFEFFADTIKLAEDTTSPYSYSWSNATLGNYALTAKVTDSSGNTSVSEIITISVINPINQLTATITSPANNSSFNEGSSITIQATASGGTGTLSKIEFFVGTTLLGEDITSPYSYTWPNVTAGNYSLTAKVTDNGNNTAVSTIINIKVINPLIATITSPTNNASFNEGSTITIQATASGGTGVISKMQFFDGTTLLGEDATSPYSFTWPNVAAGNYSLKVKATDSANNTAVSTIINITVNPVGITCNATGTISREVWNNVSGTSISSIPLSITPSSIGVLSIFQTPSNIADNYGQRIRGYVCPPLTGNYIFWISSDDNSELWLSSNNDPANKIKIAFVSGKTGPGQWSKYSSQKSASIHLTTGQPYYIEALHKESTLKDNLAVGWQLPNGVLERPIPGIRLSPLGAITPPSLIELFTAGSSWKFPIGEANISDTKVKDGSLQQNTILENSYNMIVYPNPTTGQFNLELCINGLLEKTILIEVINSFGQVVYKKRPQKINGCVKEAIELQSSLPTGVYIMKVTTDDKIQTAKMLLTK